MKMPKTRTTSNAPPIILIFDLPVIADSLYVLYIVTNSAAVEVADNTALYLFLHTLHRGFRFNSTVSNFMVRPSQKTNLFFRVAPNPARYFIASTACIDPMTPGAAPTILLTPRLFFSVMKHARHGVSGGWRKVIWPLNSETPACIMGMLRVTDTMFKMCLDSKLSRQSTMISELPTSRP